MIDPRGAPAWQQLAALLRARIEAGEWPPGALLPPAPRLRHEYGVGKATVKAAVDALRSDGLVDLERGIGMRVREPVVRERVPVPRAALITARPPTPDERASMAIPEGVHVLEVTVGGRVRGVYPADRTALSTA
ncbi:GntR family transcriptional regulator [Micromonospora gifhornensis]|uniref:GntR family transcriptional regulator n=1 Tax=Micromonospora gifhornensis TaxID=84594 RepID=UPI00345275F7